MDNDTKQRVINAVQDPNTEFCLIPSPQLKDLLAKDEHPFITALPPAMKTTMLAVPDGKGIGPLSKLLVLKYLFGELDERQKFLFDRCQLHSVGINGVTTKPEISR